MNDRVTISVGVKSVIADPYDSAIELLQSADEALYQAKQKGKNRYILANLNFSNRKKI